MWNKILEIVGQYGPFPFGIMVGILINKWVVSKLLNLTEREKEALRQEKKELHELVNAKEDRIDKLHDMLNPQNRRT